MIKNGLIKRIWFSDITEHTQDGIGKLRSTLRFLPAPYQKGANKLLFLLLPQERCKQWIIHTIWNSKITQSDEKKCGSNCLGSTILGLMFANETGLLGKTVHVVLNNTHIYLVSGNRELQWTNRTLQVIENNFKTFYCSNKV